MDWKFNDEVSLVRIKLPFWNTDAVLPFSTLTVIILNEEDVNVDAEIGNSNV